MTQKIYSLMIAAMCVLQACAQEMKIDSVALPASFKGTMENTITNPEALSRFYAKLNADTAQVRVLHIGDSHVRGHFLPGYARKALEVTFGSKAMGNDPIGYNKPAIATETGLPGLVYSAIGINGATTKHFLKPEQLQKIKSYKPDLLILSFGTNEGYGNKYDSEKHAKDLKSFVDTLKHFCGKDVDILLTTAPGCYKRDQNRQFYPNPFNDDVARTTAVVAQECDIALWNIFEIAGGYLNACQNWKDAGMMQPDGVHYKTNGYETQGRLLGQAIAKHYLQLYNTPKQENTTE